MKVGWKRESSPIRWWKQSSGFLSTDWLHSYPLHRLWLPLQAHLIHIKNLPRSPTAYTRPYIEYDTRGTELDLVTELENLRGIISHEIAFPSYILVPHANCNWIILWPRWFVNILSPTLQLHVFSVCQNKYAAFYIKKTFWRRLWFAIVVILT